MTTTFYDTFTSSALGVIDAQGGFTPSFPKELPVPDGDKIMPTINRLLVMPWKLIFATQDWHPEDHISFTAQGGTYPPHCVRGKMGADFIPGLRTDFFHAIFRKGTRKEFDAYSAGGDYPWLFPGMVGWYKTIYLTGICTNICVFETALEMRAVGHQDVVVIEDACATLDLPEDNQYNPAKVRKAAEAAGIRFIQSKEILPIM